MDRFLAMKVFARVVEAGSFSKAADALRLPPASVSRTLQALEAHLGARLINRTTRSISITEDGEAYYERCVRVLGEVDDMEASLSHSKLSPKGNVKVSLPQVMAKSTSFPRCRNSSRRIRISASNCCSRTGKSISSRKRSIASCAWARSAMSGWSRNASALIRRSRARRRDTSRSTASRETLDDLERHLAVGYVLNNSGRVRNWEFVVGWRNAHRRDEAQDRRERCAIRTSRAGVDGTRPDPEFELYARSALRSGALGKC